MPAKIERAEGIELGSVRFHRISDYEFWLTPSNKIFVKHGKNLSFPSIGRNGVLQFDSPRFNVPTAVAKDLAERLKKQRQLRLNWFRADAEEKRLREEFGGTEE